MDLVTLGLAKKYTEDTAIGLGAVKGAPATIEKIEVVEGGNNVTFLWTGTDGTQQRQTLFVADGQKGAAGPQGPRGEKGEKGEPGEGGSAIIDVVELPTENIREDCFYRVLTAKFLYGQFIKNDWTLYTVNTLPETGEMCWDGTIAIAYYSVEQQSTFGYVDSNVSAIMGVPVGWYPADVLIPAVGTPYGGIISDISQASKNTIYTYLQNIICSYKDGVWTKVDIIGWRGTGESSEIFNHMSNEASGGCSHAEGYNTTAAGDDSHAEGYYTIANGDYQHVQGKYNIADTTSAFIIGNGNNKNDRSNAMTVDWNGNAKFAGVVTDKNGRLATENYVQQYVDETQNVNIIIEYQSTDVNDLPMDVYCAVSFQEFFDLMERNKLGNIWLVGVDQAENFGRETLRPVYLPEDSMFDFIGKGLTLTLSYDNEWFITQNPNAGSDTVVVTVKDGVASKSPQEIYDLVCSGRQVFLDANSDGQLTSLGECDKDQATFVYVLDDYTATYWSIGQNSRITFQDLGYASNYWVGEIETEVDNIVDTIGDIETALDSIISIQESLIGVITFAFCEQELNALKGMTWSEWCDSKYNICNFYIGSYEEPESGIVYENVVVDSAGDALIIAGTTELTADTVIIPSSKIIEGQEYNSW